jgi:hypothetical protein
MLMALSYEAEPFRSLTAPRRSIGERGRLFPRRYTACSVKYFGLSAAAAPLTRYQMAGAGPAVTVQATADEDVLAQPLVA